MLKLLPMRLRILFFVLILLPMPVVQAQALLPVTESAAPVVTQASPLPQAYHARWARQSVKILEENGLTLPDQINYAEQIGRDDFLRVLARVAAVAPSQLQITQPLTGEITRAEAIQRVILAFGLREALRNDRLESRFIDLGRQHPFYTAIALAESLKLINGYPDQTIRPNERLSWGEALILIENLYSWRQALPVDAPQWVRNHQQRQNMWYQLVDGFRLLLTLVYAGLALFFIARSWRRTRHQQGSPLKALSFLLSVLTLLLSLMWLNEILFNYHLIPREIYALGALISVFIALLMLKAGTYLDGKISEPKPQAVIDAGYVEAINSEKGEIFIKDSQTALCAMAVITPDTKIFSHLDGQASAAFFSEIRPGDLLSLKGASSFQGSVIEVERLAILSREAQPLQSQESTWQNRSVQPPAFVQNQIVVRRPPPG